MSDTKYVNEYNPNSANPNNGIQRGSKLKFNNLITCLAIGIQPKEYAELIGIHFTTLTTHNAAEIILVMEQLLRMNFKREDCKVYIIGPVNSYHGKSFLLTQLLKISTNLFVGDIPTAANASANTDVKMLYAGHTPSIFIREHVVELKNDKGAFIPKPIMSTLSDEEKNSRFKQGKSSWQKDKESKPWKQVYPIKIT